MFKRCFVVISAVLFSLNVWAQSDISGVRVWAGPENTRLVLDLSNNVEFDKFMLRSPDRLVIDLRSTTTSAKLEQVVMQGNLVTKVRHSTPKAKGDTRLVIELSRATTPTVFALSPTGDYGHRLVIDLPDTAGQAEIKQEQQRATQVKHQQELTGTRDIVIAIDAGHGGDDPGAIGPKRSYEKNITLAISKRVVRLLDAEPGLKGVLIRKGDYYVDLNRRSQIAREGKADFLVSIHADGFTSSKPKGASVWVLSNRRADTEIGRWLERHEEQSELLGGAGDVIDTTDNDSNLNYMLLDMSMEHAKNTGYSVAKSVLGEISKVTSLHKSQPAYASLAVLKSPDIPSILVEAGFITNHKEEKLLGSGNHQERIAKAVVAGIKEHYSRNPPDGTLYAQRFGGRKHKVKSGESLSRIATNYGVSVANIKKVNQLKTDTIRVGQDLTIPSS
ncbi:AMIN domain-containing protein [Alginatibacterium sediminis]|uniref:N-acetylmuramoyl-L-alanine amidase n=1 Tax=Alginatibacterium sediminis TaxID=2164068 RepID=A0A420E8K1_9ALTE|nr:N-acetylmuramoyl-L-alanine amidase [Alginatibacterium sediminis]RKF14523.1 AMIN domain-containing protein [Alginatibacterium sediminis]